MKKLILNIVAVLTAITLGSCAEDDEIVVLDPSSIEQLATKIVAGTISFDEGKARAEQYGLKQHVIKPLEFQLYNQSDSFADMVSISGEFSGTGKVINVSTDFCYGGDLSYQFFCQFLPTLSDRLDIGDTPYFFSHGYCDDRCHSSLAEMSYGVVENSFRVYYKSASGKLAYYYIYCDKLKITHRKYFVSVE